MRKVIYHYPALEYAHLHVLQTHPHAQRLRTLELHQQNLDESAGRDLRRALPNLETLWVEGQGF